MAITSTDADTVIAIMNLSGGALVLAATIAAIVHNRLEKAKSNAARAKIIDNTLSISSLACSAVGFILIQFHCDGASLYFYLAGGIFYTANFVIRSEKPSRFEIFVLIFWFSFVAMAYIGLLTPKIIESNEKVEDSYKKMSAQLDDISNTLASDRNMIRDFISTNHISKTNSN